MSESAQNAAHEEHIESRVINFMWSALIVRTDIRILKALRGCNHGAGDQAIDATLTQLTDQSAPDVAVLEVSG